MNVVIHQIQPLDHFFEFHTLAEGVCMISPEPSTAATRLLSHLDFHISVSENHVEVIMDHSELFPQLGDQVLVHRVLLVDTLH